MDNITIEIEKIRSFDNKPSVLNGEKRRYDCPRESFKPPCPEKAFICGSLVITRISHVNIEDNTFYTDRGAYRYKVIEP